MAKNKKAGGSSSSNDSLAFYTAIVAVAISAAGVALGILALVAPSTPELLGLLGMSQSADSSALFAYGSVMIVQSVFGLVMGIFGIRATRSNYPPDGKPFFAFAIIALLLSVGGMLAAGSASLVSIVIDGLCAYFAWGIMHRPLPKNKKKKHR